MQLKATEGRSIIKYNKESKNWHTFSNGTKIRRERDYNNLNRRETQGVNAIVVDAENIPAGVEILIHPNAPIESNRIYNFRQLCAEDSGDIQYYSILKDQCFIWKNHKDEWLPIPPYEKALRVYIPYNGYLTGIEPEKIKNTLYVLTGLYKDKCVLTLNSCDYEVVYQDTNGQEGRLIRFRPQGDENSEREPEAIAILDEATKKVNNGEYYVGLEPSKSKPLQHLIHA